MDSFWERLDLEPTRDISAIKRAYAQKTRTCHPEEDPEGFLELRRAYQAALDYAQGQDESAPAARRRNDQESGQDGFPARPAGAGEEDAGWSLCGEEPESAQNPYQDHEAIRRFVELYTGKQRKNSRLWMDYFTSDAFLDVGWDSPFTALLLEKVTQAERSFPPGKEFALWLSIAYQFSVEEKLELNRDEFRVERREVHLTFAPGALFDGAESIVRIAEKGPVPKKPRGNEFAILQSFQDYRHLIRLSQAGRWDREAMEAYREILNRYSLSYIRERCEQRVSPECERHPAGVRVFLHFFQRPGLPDAVFRDAWRRLDLKSAIMGRAKALYGPLRDRVLERLPDIGRETQENFFRLNQDLDAYLSRIKANPEGEEAASAAFFAGAQVQKALMNPRFVEKELLTYSKWRREGMGEGLVRRLLNFYREHPDIPRAGEAAAGLADDLRRQAVKRRNREDAQAEPFPKRAAPSLAYRPFLRHWLNTGFYTARDPESGKQLLEYLEDCLPYQKAWSRRFAEKAAAVVIGHVEIDFHPAHMEFRVDGKSVYRPCLSWEQAAACADGDRFFFLLPITAAPYPFFGQAAAAIYDRLAFTAVPEEDRAVIARCLACHVCCLPVDGYTGKPVPPEKALPLEIYAQDGERLYVCVWREDEGPVALFRQTASGRRAEGEYRPERGESRLEAARRMLAQAVSPDRFDLSRLRELPWNIYFTPNAGSEEHLRRPDLQDPPEGEGSEASGAEGVAPEEQAPDPVTQEALSSLLVRFARGGLERLELEWFEGRLVLRRDGGRYACLYFEACFGRGDGCWHSLLSDSEMYRTVDSSDIVYVPFGMGRLPVYSVFDSAPPLMAEIAGVLAQMGRGRLQSGGGRMWTCGVSLHDGMHKLLMAQQKLGGVPPRRGRNYLLAKFVFSRYPDQLESVDLRGERTAETLKSGSYGQAAAGLVRFMMGKLARLRLSWLFKTPEGEAYRRHLVLLQDGGRFMLLWLRDDEERSDAYVSDDPADGPETFLGCPAPAFLIHRNLARIRNCVDLLLDDIDRAGPVVDRSGAFAPVSRPYEETRAALAGQAQEA